MRSLGEEHRYSYVSLGNVTGKFKFISLKKKDTPTNFTHIEILAACNCRWYKILAKNMSS